MNKTLLLILCDFLLLTLLALTRWETAEPPRPRDAAVPELAANASTREQDLVETMRQSLADEQAARDELAEKLAATDSALTAREQSLAEARAERAASDTRLAATQRTAAELDRKVAAVTQEATLTKEQLAQLQRELAEKQAEAERQRAALAKLEEQQTQARRQIEGLTMAVVVSEQEKKTLRETAESLKGQVEVERAERMKVTETTVQLAAGVGQLAERSVELTKEIRDNRPINANVLFGEFTANRVTASFATGRKGFLGPVNRAKDTATILVSDGAQTYALMHIADTVYSLGENGSDWESLSVVLVRAGVRQPAASLRFLRHDPRLVVVPVDAGQVAALGAKVYPVAADPFKFPEAVLIDGDGRGYGEVGFKLDPAEPGFVRVDNRLFKRLFGDFAPKRGDLVFAKTGELLGLMVNSDYCALLKSFAAAQTIRTGPDIRDQATGALFDSLGARARALPVKLQ